ncbi:MAG TPA: rhodanese-like domain-containing protein [Ktedonobacteraceae bacterium]|nr:rhodanese-like domain-containing protein [Ktedonobacteraceae bacterium]
MEVVGQANEIPEVDPLIASEQMASGEIAILDVREQPEWDSGHIEGSKFIPLYELQWRWSELDRDKKWVCVCLAGVRSYYAAALLLQAGYDVANMAGGMLAWQAAKLPITDPGIVLGH